MEPKFTAVFGIFRHDDQVKMSIDKLLFNGFSISNIKVFCPSTTSISSSEKLDIDRFQKTMIFYFLKIGSCIGAIIFFILGLGIVLKWIEIGLLMDMDIFQKTYVLLFTTLFGFFFGAASGALIGIGTPQTILLRFANYIDAGATLLSVQVRNLDEECAAIQSFESCGASDIAKLDEKQTWDSIYNSQTLELKIVG